MPTLHWTIIAAALVLLRQAGAAQQESPQWHRQWWRGAAGKLPTLLARDNYNASDVVNITGQDLSRPYAGADPTGPSRWTLQARVAGLVPIDNGDRVAGRAEVALVIAPDAFAGDSLDDRWSVCSWTWPSAMADAGSVETLRARDPDRKCVGVLGDGCAARLHSDGAVAAGVGCDGFLNGGWGTAGSGCENLTSPLSQPPSGSGLLRRSIRQAVSSDNGSYHVLATASVSDNATDESEAWKGYDRIMTNVYNVLLVVHWHDRDGNTGGNKTWSWMRCLRATDIQEGSKAPESLGDRPVPDHGSVMRVSGSGVFIVAAAVALAFL
ncbi:hypothetical protein RB597_000350 [Gaeumannomyces tritici]